MNAQTVPRPAGAVKPVVYLRLPARPFNTYDTWPSVTVLGEGSWGSLLAVRLDDDGAAVTLGALYALGAQRAERTRA